MLAKIEDDLRDPGSDSLCPPVYSYTVKRADPEQWSALIDGFSDANIFQTSAFSSVKSPRAQIESMIIRRGDEIVAVALVRITSTFIGLRSAYVRWGPLWRRKGAVPNFEVWRHAIKLLRLEYATKRKMWLRLFPLAVKEDEHPYGAALSDEGFAQVQTTASRTMVLDLSAPLAQLRKGLEQKWRNCLNNAERNNLEIVEGTGEELFERFLVPFTQMVSRKRLEEPGDIAGFKAIQAILPDRHKLRVFLCYANGEICAGAIASAFGQRGVYHFGATADSGMRTKASYLLQWRIITWLKEMGCIEYDLHGVNRTTNPGVYNFKAGLCGKNGREVEFLGTFDTYGSVVAFLCAKTADKTVRAFPRLKQLLTRSAR